MSYPQELLVSWTYCREVFVIEIPAFDARDKFSRLLDRVQLGEEVIITRRGQPVARLVPSVPPYTEVAETETLPLQTSNSR
jgi:prevent-host-death family protein